MAAFFKHGPLPRALGRIVGVNRQRYIRLVEFTELPIAGRATFAAGPVLLLRALMSSSPCLLNSGWLPMQGKKNSTACHRMRRNHCLRWQEVRYYAQAGAVSSGHRSLALGVERDRRTRGWPHIFAKNCHPSDAPARVRPGRPSAAIGKCSPSAWQRQAARAPTSWHPRPPRLPMLRRVRRKAGARRTSRTTMAAPLHR